MDSDDELLRLILASKNKIWEDKKRLGVKGCEQRKTGYEKKKEHVASVSPSYKNIASLPSDVRDTKKKELIKKLSSSPWPLELGENQNIKKKNSPRTLSPLPCDVREIEKNEFISNLSSSGLALLDEHKEKKSPNSRPVSPLPEDVRENKKDELISKLTSVDGLTSLGEQKKSPRREFQSPLPDDVREQRKDELISKLTSTEGLVNLGEQKKSPRSEFLSSLPDDVREIKKDVLISSLTLEGGLVHSEKEKGKNVAPVLVVQDCEKGDLISSLTSVQGLVGENEAWNKEVDSMVRFGEYSPQNPGLLSPGKTLLGLGEYEEKRRQILERKKREYLEQMAQARQVAKDVRHQQDTSEFVMKLFVNDAATQTDLKITGYLEDEGGLSPMVVSTQTPGGEVPVFPNMSTNSNFTNISTQTSGGNVKLSKSVPVANASPNGFTTTPQSLPVYHPLSPRERKMAEFRESYSPSFLQGLPVYQGDFEMSSEPDIRRRREAYHEDLRKQIEEKKRIDAEEQEKERRKEAAIARRAELQRERMRQEYIKEETLRRERQMQRMRQAEEFQRRQEALKLEEELVREAEARRKLEKRLEDLEAGLAHHTTCSTQSLGVSLPVPALRSKFFKEDLLEHQTPLEETALTMESKTVNTSGGEYNKSDNNLEPSVSAEPKILPREKTKYTPQFSDLSYSPRGSHSDVNLNRYSALKESSESVTISYHRPPPEILKAAGYNESTPVLDENRNLFSEPKTRHSHTFSNEVSNESPVQPVQKSNLDNDLSIPILRAPSPVIPAVRLGQAVSGSNAMNKVEAKWQVPAVEKTVINTGSNPNSILTQLGAVRHQLQLEQMRMEQHLQNKLKHKSC